MRLPAFLDNYLFRANKVLGLEVFVKADESYEINACLCERKGSAVSVSFSISGLSSLETLFEKLPDKKVPVCLVIHGKGIIHKKISLGEGEGLSSAFHKVFSSGNEDEFYTQLYCGPGANAFVSVTRKDRADALVTQVESSGAKVIDFFLGPFVVENSFALMPAQSSVHEFTWLNHKMEIEDAKIKEYVQNEVEKSGTPFELGGFSLESKLLIAFSAAFSYFVLVAYLSHTNQVVANGGVESKNARAFTKLLRVTVVLLLILSLGNFMFFNNYFEKQKKLDAELTVSMGSLAMYEKLESDLKGKNSFLERSGLGFSSRISFFTDRLLYDLPGDISLSYFSVYPLKNRIEKDSLLKFDNKKVSVKGFCDKSIVLNNWITLLKSKDFIQDVVLESYEQESDKGNGKFDITVKLK